MNSRSIHRLWDEVLRQVRSAHRRKALNADLRLELCGGVDKELAHLARERSQAVDLADHVVPTEELADGDGGVAELDFLLQLAP
eukprot:11193208-Heterocapsa_arctica.AAC.1